MSKVKLFSDFEKHDFLLTLLKRQSKGFVGDRYRHLEFVSDNSYAYAVCFNYPTERLLTPIDRNHCFVMEPPEILPALQLRGLEQIGHYYTPVEACLKQLGVRGVNYPMAVMLHTPLLEKSVQKTRRMSMIVSTKKQTPYQAKRFELIQALLKTNLDIDFYGRALPFKDSRVKGELPSLNKKEGLASYDFSIACENTNHLGCISEKFYDCIVNDCIPISNAPGALIRFSDSSIYLDFNKPVQHSVAVIADIMNWSTPRINLYRAAVQKLKTRVIEGDLSLMNKIASIIPSA